MGSEAGTISALSAGHNVFVGGTVDTMELGSGTLAAAMAATGDIALYMHNDAVVQENLLGTTAPIRQAFAGTGPGEVELGCGQGMQAYFDTTFRQEYTDQGFLPNEANVDLTLADPTAPDVIDAGMLAIWKAAVDAARTVGIATMAPIISPNAAGDDLASWMDPYWSNARQAALYGGALAIDAPPAFFLDRGDAYDAFTEQQIRWANANGLRTSVIVSPFSHEAQDNGAFLSDTEAFVADLRAADALPAQWDVEDYTTGSTFSATAIASVALWLAQQFPSPGATAGPAAVGTTAPAGSDWIVTTAGTGTAVSLGAQTQQVSSVGTDTIQAGSGLSVIYASGPSVSVAGGSGSTVFVGAAGTATVQGAGGSSTLYGGSGGGTLAAGTGGNSILVAGTGNTTLAGAADGDVMFGGVTGSTCMVAGAGREIMVGGGGPDTMTGGPGVSVAFAGTGADTFVAGGGGVQEVVGYRPASDHLVLAAGTTISTVTHGDWGTTAALSDGTVLVLFGTAL